MEKSNKLIILDLDETLIHATEEPLEIPHDFTFEQYFVYKRPFLHEFLTGLSEHFPIAVWSSAGDDYVSYMVSQIKPDNIEFCLTWGRSRCTMRYDYIFGTCYYEKRLNKLKNRGFKLEQILIVDDTPSKSKSNYGNAIYIKEFNGDTNDQELEFLLEYLLSLKDVDNVRVIEKRGWRK